MNSWYLRTPEIIRNYSRISDYSPRVYYDIEWLDTPKSTLDTLLGLYKIDEVANILKRDPATGRNYVRVRSLVPY